VLCIIWFQDETMKKPGIIKTLIILLIVLSGNVLVAELPEFLRTANMEVSVIIKVADKPGFEFNQSINRHDLTRQEKYNFALTGLKNRAGQSQRELIDILKANKAAVTEFKDFWISNAIYLKGDAGFIRELASRDDIELIFENLPLVLVEPVEIKTAPQSATGIEPGLDLIGVREAWAMGLTGKGRLVCNFDTGVDGNHSALSTSWRGSNGGSIGESWYDPYTNTSYPMDNHGHGTHTMGTMVGVDGSDTVGVAIEAEWIAAAVIDRGGSVNRTIADILSAFQWAANPDGNPETIDDMPDVINNSWGIPAGFYGPCDMTFWEAIDNLEALGIVCLFAAGNEGPNPSTIRTPADRITTQFNAFSVGAINSASMEIASFSSRGPSGCDSLTIKPEITAPGVGIRSCDNGGGYVTMSGTSMATPHVAGAVAILRQFNPEAAVDEIKAALMYGAVDMGGPGEDNDYGYGMINLLNSLYYMPSPEKPCVQVISVDESMDFYSAITSDHGTSLKISLTNLGCGSSINARLTALDDMIEILQDQAGFGVIDRFDTVTSAVFSIAAKPQMPDGYMVPLKLEFYNGSWAQVCRCEVRLSNSAQPAVATISTDELTMSFSNFGQFGLGENSISPFGGEGFRFPPGGADMLREAALLIAAAGHVSDGVRNELNQPDNDFEPSIGGQPIVTQPGLFADFDGFASYSDSAAEEPIGLLISQRCFGWESQAQFVTVEYTIHNVSGNNINDLLVGMFCDWNVSSPDGILDAVDYDDVLSLGYMKDTETGKCMGIRSITSFASAYRAIKNSDIFADGFPDSEKFHFMSEGFNQISYSTPDDYSQLITVGPLNIARGDSETVAFAFVAGETVEDILYQAELAFIMYPNLTENHHPEHVLPVDIRLCQNYPNPFNATTTIEYAVNVPSQLVIYDVMGRQVKSFAVKSDGSDRVVWDGRNDSGQGVVSGVYFYKLLTDRLSPVRKMIYLK
jgi:hypothetical protein